MREAAVLCGEAISTAILKFSERTSLIVRKRTLGITMNG